VGSDAVFDVVASISDETEASRLLNIQNVSFLVSDKSPWLDEKKNEKIQQYMKTGFQ